MLSAPCDALSAPLGPTLDHYYVVIMHTLLNFVVVLQSLDPKLPHYRKKFQFWPLEGCQTPCQSAYLVKIFLQTFEFTTKP